MSAPGAPVKQVSEDEVPLAIAVFGNVHSECTDDSLRVERLGRFVYCSCGWCDDERVYEVVSEIGGEG